MKRLIATLLSGLLLASSAMAAPTLRANVSVVGAVVTVGDMFEDAGAHATLPLFRAPAPGTAGMVDIAAVRDAAARAGLSGYATDGLQQVRVERRARQIGPVEIEQLVADDLAFRGLLPPGAEVSLRFSGSVPSFAAEAVDVPAQLLSLSWQPGSTLFSARVSIAGRAAPVDVSGQIELLVEVPHLAQNLKAGSQIGPADIEMKRVPLDYAAQNGVFGMEEIVGKALKRNGRAGLMLRASDLGEPIVVRRNSRVTVVLRTGPLALAMHGQALGDAAVGQPVSVMNPVSKKILNGVAMGDGLVEISTAADKLQLAGL